MTDHNDIVGATCFTFHPPGIESAHGILNPKWEFHMRHGDNPAFRWAHLLMPGAVRTGVTYGVIPDEEIDTEVSAEVDGGRFYHCGLKVDGHIFDTYIWARNTYELAKMLRHIGGIRRIWNIDNLTRWERFKCVLRYFWLRRPTIKLRSPVEP